ncbi:MAG: hypothetical protein ACOC2L_02295 [Candidatus Sumerlaeota bacterium]
MDEKPETGWIHRLREAMAQRSVRITIALVLLVVGAGLFLFPEQGSYAIGLDYLNGRGNELVDEALKKNGQAFLIVSGIKATLALIEGSSIGVGFDLEVGDLAQPTYDYVDFIWKMFLWATTILLAYKVLIESGILDIGLQLAGIGLLLMLPALAWPEKWRGVARWARRLVIGGLFMAFIVPMALIISDALSGHYTGPLRENQMAAMERSRMEFLQVKSTFMAIRDDIELRSPGQSLENVRARLITLISRMQRLGIEVFSTFLYFVLVSLFDLLALPFATALFLTWLAKTALGQAQRVELINPRDIQLEQAHPTGENA